MPETLRAAAGSGNFRVVIAVTSPAGRPGPIVHIRWSSHVS
jgi:hypothetical protein